MINQHSSQKQHETTLEKTFEPSIRLGILCRFEIIFPQCTNPQKNNE